MRSEWQEQEIQYDTMNHVSFLHFTDILDLDDFSGMKKKKKKKKKPYDMDGLEDALQVGIFKK